jgi:hypothetical protein
LLAIAPPWEKANVAAMPVFPNVGVDAGNFPGMERYRAVAVLDHAR